MVYSELTVVAAPSRRSKPTVVRRVAPLVARSLVAAANELLRRVVPQLAREEPGAVAQPLVDA